MTPTGAMGPNGWVAPMRAEAGDLPEGDDWMFEIKWDGMRIVARCDPGPGVNGRLTLWARSGREVTSTYPELALLPGGLGVPAVVDGEIVVFDGERPAFERLQHRIHQSSPSPLTVADHPAVYLLFDLLELDGRSLVALPYHHRRRLLEDLVNPGPAWRVPPAVDGDGARLLALARDRGLEGVVAKRRDSTYRPGARSPDWRKIKLRHRQEFVVGGWLPGQGRLGGDIGSLLVGVHSGPDLIFAGAVGSGLGRADRAVLGTALVAGPGCPFSTTPATPRPAVWVIPTMVIEVGYGSWPIGGNLRHPTYLGALVDHDPSEVVRELPS